MMVMGGGNRTAPGEGFNTHIKTMEILDLNTRTGWVEIICQRPFYHTKSGLLIFPILQKVTIWATPLNVGLYWGRVFNSGPDGAITYIRDWTENIFRFDEESLA